MTEPTVREIALALRNGEEWRLREDTSNSIDVPTLSGGLDPHGESERGESVADIMTQLRGS